MAVTRPIVIKIGGSTLGSGDTALEDLVELQAKGMPLVVVHGGGKIINEWIARSDTIPQFVRGLRVTDEQTLDTVVAVLAGLVNKRLVAKIQSLGGKAIGLSGIDGVLLQCKQMRPELGFVGTVSKVNSEPVRVMMKAGYIPIIAPVASEYSIGTVRSEAIFNVNGDSVAGSLASDLQADRLIFLTDIEGVLDASKNLIPKLDPEQAKSLIARGLATEGMIPKIESCLESLPNIRFAQIIDGRKPHALLECLSSSTMGTLVG